MSKMHLRNLKVNPLGVASGAFMILAPFGAWMTLSAFGFVSASNLWDIARSETSFPIGENIASTSLYSGVALIIAGILSFKRSKVGLPLAVVAVSLFSLESYTAFGTFPGPIPVSILPGLGFFLALCGIALGLSSLWTRTIPISSLVSSIRTRMGLGEAGISLTSLFLAADGWSHWSARQLSEYLGETPVEGIIHRVFFLGVAALFMMFLVQRRVFLNRSGSALVITVFSSLILDAIYHFVSGNIVSFVGHDATEILFHTFAYYGVVSLVAARLVLKP